jgi:hypothetical protein
MSLKIRKNIIKHCYGLLAINFLAYLIFTYDYQILVFGFLNWVLFFIIGWNSSTIKEHDLGD